MDLARLHYMANQIARNFAAMDHADAVAATADHITMFWDPRMKAAILAGDPASLMPIAAEAVRALATGAPPQSQTRTTKFDAVDEAGRSDGA